MTEPLIRPFEAVDYPGLVALHNMTYPTFPATEDEYRRWDADPGWRRWVAVVDGQVAGMAQLQPGWPEGVYRVSVAVLPAFERRGIGAALYAQLEAALAPLKPLALRAHATEARPHGLRFLAARGYVELLREFDSILDLGVFDLAPYAGAIERVAAQGIVIRSLAELAADPAAEMVRDRQTYDLYWRLMGDVPGRAEDAPPPFERWQADYLGDPRLPLEAYFVALDGARYVGQTALRLLADGETLHNELTGVLPAYRRRGIALALKLRAIAYAQAGGWPRILTSNATTNRPMLSINERLGFVKEPAWVFFQKDVQRAGRD